MSDLVVLSYQDDDTASAVRRVLGQLQADGNIIVEDAVVVTKDADGYIRIRPDVQPAVAGAASGAVSGSLIGMLFLAPALGALIGAGAGALLGGLSNYGLRDAFVREVASSILADGSALFVLAHSVDVDKVLPALSRFGGHVVRTSLSDEGEERLREALGTSHNEG